MQSTGQQHAPPCALHLVVHLIQDHSASQALRPHRLTREAPDHSGLACKLSGADDPWLGCLSLGSVPALEKGRERERHRGRLALSSQRVAFVGVPHHVLHASPIYHSTRRIVPVPETILEDNRRRPRLRARVVRSPVGVALGRCCSRLGGVIACTCKWSGGSRTALRSGNEPKSPAR